MSRSKTNIISSFIEKLINDYISLFEKIDSYHIEILKRNATLALKTIAKSNAAYHNVDHTIMVVEVGQQILRGKQILEKNVTSNDWIHFVIAAFFHDIGYVRGLCSGDKDGAYIKNILGDTIKLPKESTDAALAPYHIDRAKLYAKNELSKTEGIDADYITKLIERTRFPVPNSQNYLQTKDLPGLLRAADLMGQVADINYTAKSEALFVELYETGFAQKLGYKTGYDLRVKLPVFFKKNIRPFIYDALVYLDVTESGKIWINNMYKNIFTEISNLNGKTSLENSHHGPLVKEPHLAIRKEHIQKTNHQQLGL